MDPDINVILEGLNPITFVLSTRNYIEPDLLIEVDALIEQSRLEAYGVPKIIYQYTVPQATANQNALINHWEENHPYPSLNVPSEALSNFDAKLVRGKWRTKYLGAAQVYRLSHQENAARRDRVRQYYKFLNDNLVREWNIQRRAFIAAHPSNRNGQPNPAFTAIADRLIEALRNLLTTHTFYTLTYEDFLYAHQRGLARLDAGMEQIVNGGAPRLFAYVPTNPNHLVYNMTPRLLAELVPLTRTLRARNLYFLLTFNPVTISDNGIGISDHTSGLYISSERIQQHYENAVQRNQEYIEYYNGGGNAMTNVQIRVQRYVESSPHFRQGLFWDIYTDLNFVDYVDPCDDSKMHISDALARWNAFFPNDPRRFTQLACLHQAFKINGIDLIWATGSNDSADFQARDFQQLCEENNCCVSLMTENATNPNYYGDRSLPMVKLNLLNNHYFANEQFSDNSDMYRAFVVPNTKNYFKNSMQIMKYLRTHPQYTSPVPANEVALMISGHIDSRMIDGDMLTSDSIIYNAKEESRRQARRGDRFYSKTIGNIMEDVCSMEIDPDFEASTNTGKHLPIFCACKTEESPIPIRFYGKTAAAQLMNYCVQLYMKYKNIFQGTYEKVRKYNSNVKARAQYEYHLQLIEGEEYPQWLINRLGYDQWIFEREPKFGLRIYFHNLGYDKSYLGQVLHKITNIMGAGKSCKGFQGLYKGIVFHFRCNMALIPTALANIPKMFGIEDKQKGTQPYTFYTENSMEDFHPNSYRLNPEKFRDMINQVTPKNRESYIAESTRNGTLVWYDDYVEFFHKENMALYCESDVLIQAEGRLKYRALLYEGAGYVARCHQDYTNSGVAQSILMSSEAYDGICNLNGSVSEFVRRFICHGGRCLMRGNKKQWYRGKLYYIDFNSLYPSVQIMIKGHPIGMPKLITQTMKDEKYYEEIDRMANDDYYGVFLKLQITNIPIKRPFPLTYRMAKDGTRIYTNKCSKENPIIYGCERFGWKHLTEIFGCRPGIDFTVMDGIYYDEGRSEAMGTKMEELYWLRKQFQLDNPAVSEVLKLVLNSTWGKDMQRTFYEDMVVEDVQVFEQRMGDARNTIMSWESFTEDGSMILVKNAKRVVPTSRAHCAAEVLGGSKYLMAQLMVILDELMVYCAYSDTDSAIIDAEKYDQVRKLFKERYGKELDGEFTTPKNQPGTVHPDFKPKCISYATELIAVAKKVYYMKCLDDKTGKEYEVWKFKGMSDPENTIPHYCSMNNITVRDFFIQLLEGVSHTVPQTYEHSKPSFNHDSKNWGFSTNLYVEKTYSFPGPWQTWTENYKLRSIKPTITFLDEIENRRKIEYPEVMEELKSLLPYINSYEILECEEAPIIHIAKEIIAPIKKIEKPVIIFNGKLVANPAYIKVQA